MRSAPIGGRLAVACIAAMCVSYVVEPLKCGCGGCEVWVGCRLSKRNGFRTLLMAECSAHCRCVACVLRWVHISGALAADVPCCRRSGSVVPLPGRGAACLLLASWRVLVQGTCAGEALLAESVGCALKHRAHLQVSVAVP